ncbi:MAG: Rha family transcriptional regulator [Cetobacterium sp.]
METKYGKGWSWDDLNLTKEEKLLDEQARKELQKQFEGFDDDIGNDIPDELINIDGIAYINSRTIAKKLGKNEKDGHSDVCKKIRKIIDDFSKIGVGNFSESYFKSIESTYTSSQGKSGLRCYLLDKDMFNLIVMGSTGIDAFKFKVAYIEKFNLMEKTIKNVKTLVENTEEANKSINMIFTEINKYEKENKELLARLSNVSLFHKKQLEMSEQARLETESKLEFYKSLDNTVDSYSEGATPIVGLSEHQLRKLVHAGEQATRELVRISTMKNKRKWY